MRILLYSISYSPELAGSGRFNGEIAAWLAAQGHDVEVITAYPYYPEWKIRADYRWRGWFSEKLDNVKVYRTPLYVPRRINGLTRIFHEISFVINSSIHWGYVFFKKYDIIIAVCPPLQIAILPYIYSRLWGKPFLFHIQDLQVDAARSLKLIKQTWLLNILDIIERFLLHKATWVSSISEGMKQRILAKGVDQSCYFMLENWVDINLFKPMDVSESYKFELGFKNDDKIALYSGNIGEKQGLEILIDVAQLLESDQNIKIVICGQGATRDTLKAEMENKGITNVYFFPMRPYEELPRVLAMADVHLIIQKRAAADLVMPSKLTNVLAIGGAAIVCADETTWLDRVVRSNDLGWVTEPENSKLLADTIKSAIYSSDCLIRRRQNARQYATSFLSKEKILLRLEDFLLQTLK